MTSATNPYALSALRVVTGFLFFQHGYPKLFGSLPGSGDAEGAAEFLSVIWVSGFLEVVGGILILAGLLTRPVAFIHAGEMAVAYFWRHQPDGLHPLQNGGETPVLFCFGFFLLVFAGGGAYALDTVLAGRRRATATR